MKRLIRIRPLLLLSLIFTTFVSVAKAPRPNILFILTDDQGYADVGFNGSKDIVTPNLDELAENGTILTSAYVTHPFCGPSRAGLLTGRYPHKFGSQFNLPSSDVSGGLGIPVSETYMSTVLQNAGYYTGAVGKWHLGEMPEYHPNNRGFDEFYGFLNGGHTFFPEQYLATYDKLKAEGREHTIWHYNRPLEHNGKEVRGTKYMTDELSDEASKFIVKAKKKKQPFFLYLAYNAPHTPLEATEADMAMFPNIKDKKRKTYAGMVYAIDRGVKQLVQTLKDTKQFDNTLIVFLSDNGGRPDKGANNFPLQAGKGSVHEGGYRSPMFLHWPKSIASGKTYRHPVSALDLYPTFAGLAGAKIPENKVLDGKDIYHAVKNNKSARPGESIYVMRHGHGFTDTAARRDNLKAIKTFKNGWKLYDVENDPAETNDLSDKYPIVLREIIEDLKLWSWTNTQPSWFHNQKTGTDWRSKGMPRFHETFQID